MIDDFFEVFDFGFDGVDFDDADFDLVDDLVLIDDGGVAAAITLLSCCDCDAVFFCALDLDCCVGGEVAFWMLGVFFYVFFDVVFDVVLEGGVGNCDCDGCDDGDESGESFCCFFCFCWSSAPSSALFASPKSPVIICLAANV